MAIKMLHLEREFAINFISSDGSKFNYTCKRWVDASGGHVELDLRFHEFGLVASYNSQTKEIKHMQIKTLKGLRALMGFISL